MIGYHAQHLSACYESGTGCFRHAIGEEGRIRPETGVHQAGAIGPDPFVVPLGTRLAKTREELEAAGVGVVL